MGDILKVWDEENSIWIPIPAIQGAQGPQGPKGDKGDTGDFSPLDAYPVGAFYISAVQTSPAELFGGNWERITGQFLLGTDTTENNPGTYSAGSTGGSERVTLSEAQIPAHTHGFKWLSGDITTRPLSNKTSSLFGAVSGIMTTPRASGTFTGGVNYTSIDATKGWNIHVNATHEHDSVGNDESHDNMPPYLAVYMWKRIA